MGTTKSDCDDIDYDFNWSLQDPDMEVRVSALKIMLKINCTMLIKRYQDRLVELLECLNEEVRVLTLNVLQLVTYDPLVIGRHEDAIASRLDDTSGVVRATAVKSLLLPLSAGGHSFGKYSPRVYKLLLDPDEMVRLSILEALSRYESGSEYENNIISLMMDSSGLVRAAAIDTLGPVGIRKRYLGLSLKTHSLLVSRTKEMHKHLSDPSPEVKCSALRSLEHLGFEGPDCNWYVDDVIALLNDPSDMVRITALITMSKMPSHYRQFYKWVIASLRKDKSELVRQKFLELESELGPK